MWEIVASQKLYLGPFNGGYNVKGGAGFTCSTTTIIPGFLPCINIRDPFKAASTIKLCKFGQSKTIFTQRCFLLNLS